MANARVGNLQANDIGCASEVWRALTGVLTQLSKATITVASVVSNGIVTAGRAVWNGITWIGKNIFLPISMTGINVMGYTLDKILYGSPGLRPYLQNGLLSCDIPLSWRNFVRNNAGWDIYEHSHPVIDNIFGLLGAGVGVLNFLNHFTTSVVNNIKLFWNILGSYGVFKPEATFKDERNLPVKIIFGLITLPIFIVPVLITNVIDATCTIIKNLTLSFWHNVRSTFNLLGSEGVMGERREHADKRGLLAKIVYGILTFPLVFATSALINIIDMHCSFIKNFVLSWYHNLRVTCNLLGKNGVFGERKDFADTRDLQKKIIFGFLSFPFVVATALVTNFIDAACAFIKNLALSIYYNTRVTFNLLGENGVMGPRNQYEDERGMPAKVIYGILSFPLVAIPAVITNVIDAACAFIKNLVLSIYYNTRVTFNLLGKDGVMGERRSYDDQRGLPAKIAYGIFSFPFVFAASGVLNLLDALCAALKNMTLSWWRNLRSTFNLLGKDGVMGPRKQHEDGRGMPAKVIYGILTFPLVVIPAVITNLIDVACAFIKNLALSCYYNTRAIFNLLGKYGLMGERRSYDDRRGLPAKIAYGIFSFPFVFAAAAVTNLVDALSTLGAYFVFGVREFVKNLALSFWRNLRTTYNLLGEDGVMGNRKEYKDDRSKVVRVVYGIFSFPLVAVAAAITNLVDGFCAVVKNLVLSWWRNLRSVFNFLGEDGVMGPRNQYKDDRGMPAKVIYGIFSFPLVAIPAVITNFIDGACAFIKNLVLSLYYNTRATFNLLGKDGVMGERSSYDDKRGLLAKIIYGIFSFPFVFVASAVTNLLDGFCAAVKNMALSWWRNLRSVFNLLGEDGVMGPRNQYKDDRGIPAKVIYGILSFPLVAIPAVITNFIDGACAFIKNLVLSLYYNTRATFNLLGKHGVMGERRSYDDKRGLLAKIVYGIFSFPFVFVASALTNLIDAFCVVIKNIALSWWRNLRSTFNLLGENGVMGPRNQHEDERSMPAKVIYGILSFPLVAISAAISNVIDGACAFIKNLALSIYQNTRATFNLLGKNGVMGERRSYDDKRGLLAKIAYGIFSFPFVFAASGVLNLLDGIGAFFKNTALSLGRNLRSTFNLLGEHGVMGKRREYKDDRGIVARVFYGALTFPFVAVSATVTNLIDGVCGYFKNYHHTIVTPAKLVTGAAVGALAAVPVFLFRNFMMGLYNCTIRPFVDHVQGRPFNGLRLVKGLVNTATVGLFGAVVQIFKAVTGYTSRFGFPNDEPKNKLISDNFNEVQSQFRVAAKLAATGKFPAINDGVSFFRPLMRIFYGMRHKTEEMVKKLHDAYLVYADTLRHSGAAVFEDSYKLVGFFGSPEFTAAKAQIKAGLRPGEKNDFAAVKQYFGAPKKPKGP